MLTLSNDEILKSCLFFVFVTSQVSSVTFSIPDLKTFHIHSSNNLTVALWKYLEIIESEKTIKEVLGHRNLITYRSGSDKKGLSLMNIIWSGIACFVLYSIGKCLCHVTPIGQSIHCKNKSLHWLCEKTTLTPL